MTRGDASSRRVVVHDRGGSTVMERTESARASARALAVPCVEHWEVRRLLSCEVGPSVDGSVLIVGDEKGGAQGRLRPASVTAIAAGRATSFFRRFYSPV